jgi:hypothetical protein
MTTVIFVSLLMTITPWTNCFFLRHHSSRIGGLFVWTSTTRGAASAAVVDASNEEDRANARRRILQGMQAFRNGNITESIQFFNDAEQAQGPTLTPFLWQRGISYYYHDDYELASRQFRIDVRVNPNDVEEIVWDIASQLRGGAPFPVPNQLALPPGARDRRRIMVRNVERRAASMTVGRWWIDLKTVHWMESMEGFNAIFLFPN